jgi:hypothetical protein
MTGNGDTGAQRGQRDHHAQGDHGPCGGGIAQRRDIGQAERDIKTR